MEGQTQGCILHSRHVSGSLFVCLAAEAEKTTQNSYTACCHTIMQHTLLKYCQYNKQSAQQWLQLKGKSAPL